MDTRGKETRVPIAREPLADSTARVVNTSMPPTSRRSRIDGTGNLEPQEHNLQTRTQMGSTTSRQATSEPKGSDRRAQVDNSQNRVASVHFPRPPSNMPHPGDGAQPVSKLPKKTMSHKATRASRDKTAIGPWELGETLGEGSSGLVRMGRHRVDGTVAAVKIIERQKAAMAQSGSIAKISLAIRRERAEEGLQSMPLAIHREVTILSLIRHPNIIEMLDLWENRQRL